MIKSKIFEPTNQFFGARILMPTSIKVCAGCWVPKGGSKMAASGPLGAILRRPCGLLKPCWASPARRRSAKSVHSHPQDAQKARQRFQTGPGFAKNAIPSQNQTHVNKKQLAFQCFRSPGHAKSVCEATNAAQTRPGSAFQRRRCTKKRSVNRSRQARADTEARKAPKTIPRQGVGAKGAARRRWRKPPPTPPLLHGVPQEG